MKVLTGLKKVRKLLEKKERWTKGFFARTAFNSPCNPGSARATSFCLMGAINVVSQNDDEIFVELEQSLKKRIRTTHLSYWNDAPRRTHAQVLRLLDKAIKAAS